MRKRSHDEPNGVTGESRGRIERAVVQAEETVARKVFGKCTLMCGDDACRRGCVR